MQVRQQQSDARAASAVRTYDDGTEATIILLRASDEETHQNLSYVFSLHGARMADLEAGVPCGAKTVGSCVIRDDGFLMTIQGAGSTLLGLQMDASWGTTSPRWRRAALGAGCVWVGLLTGREYDQAFLSEGVAAGVGGPVIPPTRVLKLEALLASD